MGLQELPTKDMEGISVIKGDGSASVRTGEDKPEAKRVVATVSSLAPSPDKTPEEGSIQATERSYVDQSPSIKKPKYKIYSGGRKTETRKGKIGKQVTSSFRMKQSKVQRKIMIGKPAGSFSFREAQMIPSNILDAEQVIVDAINQHSNLSPQ